MSIQRRPCRSPKQRCIHAGDRVMPFAASPGKKQKHLRKAARAQRQAGAKAVPQIPKVHIVTSERHFPFVHRESESHGSPDGVLEALSKQQNVWRTKAIVLKTAERGIAVYVRSAKRGLKIKGHSTARSSSRFRNQQAHSHRSRPVA